MAYLGPRTVLVNEKRSRPFVPETTDEFENLLACRNDKRVHLLSQKCVIEWICHPKEEYLIVAETSNLHRVTITNVPYCDCPLGLTGVTCRHIVYVLVKILKLPAPLWHQKAFLRAELDWMLDDHVPSDNYCARKPSDEQEYCYICQDDLNAKENVLTWCRSQCRVNFHQSCILKWAATNWEHEDFVVDRNEVKCPHCRTVWDFTSEELKEAIEIGRENGYLHTQWGYTNVAKILGMGESEYSEAEDRAMERFV